MKVSARGVLHAHGHGDAARHQAVLLVLHRARAHGHIGEKVDEVLEVGGVEHLVRREHAGLLHNAQVHAADGLHALEEVCRRLGVGVVEKPLVAGTTRARLVGVDARHHEELVLYLVGKLGKARHVVEDRVLAVGRAGPNHKQATRGLASNDGRHLGVEGGFSRRHVRGEGHLLADLHGDGQTALEGHGHGTWFLSSNSQAAHPARNATGETAFCATTV